MCWMVKEVHGEWTWPDNIKKLVLLDANSFPTSMPNDLGRERSTKCKEPRI